MATSTPTPTPTDRPKFQIVSPESYLPLRLALLEKEKAHTRAHDAITAERRALPLVEVTKPYTFTTLDSNGQEKTVTLLDLFEGRRQLIVKHFMFGPDSTEGCVSCSMGADVSNHPLFPFPSSLALWPSPRSGQEKTEHESLFPQVFSLHHHHIP
jgi:hypothetical protein